MAPGQGFEPRFADPKSAVLPLDDPGINPARLDVRSSLARPPGPFGEKPMKTFVEGGIIAHITHGVKLRFANSLLFKFNVVKIIKSGYTQPKN